MYRHCVVYSFVYPHVHGLCTRQSLSTFYPTLSAPSEPSFLFSLALPRVFRASAFFGKVNSV